MPVRSGGGGGGGRRFTPLARPVQSINTGMSVQSVINAAAPNTIFNFQPGTYNVALTPRSGDTYDGGDWGATLDGQDTLGRAFNSSTANNVTIQGFVIKRYNTSLQAGAVHSFGCTGWTIVNNHITLNAAVAVCTDSGAQVLNNLLDWNGQEGYAAHGSDILYQGNEIAYNNHDLVVDMTWEAGGGKAWETVNATFRNNYVHDNGGNGMWDDTNNIYITYDGNIVDNNTGAGIYHEIGYEATIINNTVTRNGMPSSPGGGEQLGWMWDAGIQIRLSRPVSTAAPILVSNNMVIDNYNGISLLDSPSTGATNPGESAYGTLYLDHVTVTGNTVTQNTGSTGVVQDGRGTVAVFDNSNLIFTNNTYRMVSATHPTDGHTFGWLAWRDTWTSTFATWQGYGHDAAGSLRYGNRAVTLGALLSPRTPPPPRVRQGSTNRAAALAGNIGG